MPERTDEQRLLLEQIKQIADGLGQTLAPFCEIVVHDLLEPGQSILAIHNNLSGRGVGDPTTELGEARITDPHYPQILANYANQFADGRLAKSTSIGIKDSSGRYIAALCMNVDLTLFRSLQMAMGQFVQTAADGPEETLDPASTEVLRTRIDAFAARLATTPRALKTDERRALLAELKASGLLEVRRAMETIAAHLGVSRATVYSYAR